MKTFFMLLTAVSLASALLLSHSQAVALEPVTLQGFLQQGEYFGPPGYGETPEIDSINRFYYLHLPAKHQREAFFQLVTTSPIPDRLVGSRVRASGEIFEGDSGHHQTRLLLDADTIEKVK